MQISEQAKKAIERVKVLQRVTDESGIQTYDEQYRVILGLPSEDLPAALPIMKPLMHRGKRERR
ncbi:MAG: hypothetical protein J2P13_10170 [Acidobacteria bacterium]|nr:hypothetical protein [Acidobacteriota bacterium]